MRYYLSPFERLVLYGTFQNLTPYLTGQAPIEARKVTTTIERDKPLAAVTLEPAAEPEPAPEAKPAPTKPRPRGKLPRRRRKRNDDD